MVIDHVSQIQNILIKLNVGYFSYNLFTTKLIYENEDTDIFSNPPDSSNVTTGLLSCHFHRYRILPPKFASFSSIEIFQLYFL